MEMRTVFCEELDRLMEKNPDICVIDADLAKADGTFPLRQKYPDRALDVGVAEANMASVAAGMAAYGFRPFITTFGCFATRRICDQIMISIAYARQNVKIVGTDPGVTAELNGGTHMPFEDIGVVRSIPEIVIFEPVDEVQLRQAMPQIAAYNGCMYIRLFRKTAMSVFTAPNYCFDLFTADILTEGSDVTILATGHMTHKAVEAADCLKKMGICAEVINVHTIKPLDRETILKSVRKTGAVVTAENHNVIGGLYSAVSELLAEVYPMHIGRVGVEDAFGSVGKLKELEGYYHLTTEAIVEKVRREIERKGTK